MKAACSLWPALPTVLGLSGWKSTLSTTAADRTRPNYATASITGEDHRSNCREPTSPDGARVRAIRLWREPSRVETRWPEAPTSILAIGVSTSQEITCRLSILAPPGTIG
jgi:hypothetical protein